MVTEIIIDGSLVYIDTLAMNGDGRLLKDIDNSRYLITVERPYLIYRTA